MQSPLRKRMTELVRGCILDLPLSVSAAELNADFEEELVRQGLLGGVCHCLIERADSSQRVLEWAKENYRDSFFQTAGFHALMGKLNEALAERKIHVLLLKGAHLSLSHYPVLGTRHLSDIDIYIPDPAWVEPVQRCLRESGLAPPDGLGSWQDGQGRIVDVHCPDDEIVEGQLMDFELAVRRCQPVPGFSHLKGMHEEDLTAYVALHALKHGFCKLSWLWDLHRLGADRRPAALPGRARHYIQFLMAHCFQLSQQRVHLSWWERWLLQRMLRHPYSGLGQVMLSIAMKSPLQTLVFLLRSAFFNNFGNRKTLHLKGLLGKLRNIVTALWGRNDDTTEEPR